LVIFGAGVLGFGFTDEELFTLISEATHFYLCGIYFSTEVI